MHIVSRKCSMNFIAKTPAFILGFALSLSALAQAADTFAEKRYPLAGRGELKLNVPANWVDSLDQPPKESPPTISFKTRQGKPFIVTLTPAWKTRPDEPAPTRENLRKRVQSTLDGILPFAVEKEIKLVEIKGPSGPGFYFSATDSAPKPGEYKFMIQGALAVNELSLLFTILTNDGQEDVIRSALAMVRSTAHLKR